MECGVVVKVDALQSVVIGSDGGAEIVQGFIISEPLPKVGQTGRPPSLNFEYVWAETSATPQRRPQLHQAAVISVV